MQINIMADDRDVTLLAAIEDGLPFCKTPYAEIGSWTSMNETEVLDRLKRMQANPHDPWRRGRQCCRAIIQGSIPLVP